MTGKVLTVLLLLFANTVSGQNTGTDNKTKKVLNLNYKLKLGWFTLGSGEVKIEEDAMTVNGHKYHQVYAYTSTLGLGNWLSNLDDKYNALIDKKTYKSYYSYKNVVVGKSRWEEWDTYNYDSLKVAVKIKDYRNENPDKNWSVDINQQTYDILGTFLYFKGKDWSKVQINDSLIIDTFYEKKLYKVGVQYMGEDVIDYNGNDIKAYKLHLLLPDHENLKKDRPVVLWFSKDKSHIPIRIETKLFIGFARCELYTVNDKEPVFK